MSYIYARNGRRRTPGRTSGGARQTPENAENTLDSLANLKFDDVRAIYNFVRRSLDMWRRHKHFPAFSHLQPRVHLDPVYSAGAGRARAERGLNWGTRYPNFVRLQWRARPGLNFNLSIFCRSGALHVNKRLFGGRAIWEAIMTSTMIPLLYTHIVVTRVRN